MVRIKTQNSKLPITHFRSNSKLKTQNSTLLMTHFTLNLVEGSATFSFTPTAAKDLQAALDRLLESLKVVANKPVGGRATPQPPLEYRYTGEVFLEIFCNPNIWPTPFAAKVLVTLRDDRIRLTTAAELSRLREDLSHYLEQAA